MDNNFFRFCTSYTFEYQVACEQALRWERKKERKGEGAFFRAGKRAQRLLGQRSVRYLLWLLGNSLAYEVAYETISEEVKMAAATARQIPVVNNVITDEDFEPLRTEGKVRRNLMQRGYLIGKNSEITYCFLQHSGKLVPVSVLKTHKLLTDKHSVSR